VAETTRKTAVKKASATKATPAKAAAGPKAVAKKETVKKAAVAPATNLLVMPGHEEIARRAYELWAERGFSHGDPNHDWVRAEQELRRA
jgi:hypothetical protein